MICMSFTYSLTRLINLRATKTCSRSALTVSKLHRPVGRTTHHRLGSRGFESSKMLKYYFAYVFVQVRMQGHQRHLNVFENLPGDIVDGSVLESDVVGSVPD